MQTLTCKLTATKRKKHVYITCKVKKEQKMEIWKWLKKHGRKDNPIDQTISQITKNNMSR